MRPSEGMFAWVAEVCGTRENFLSAYQKRTGACPLLFFVVKAEFPGGSPQAIRWLAAACLCLYFSGFFPVSSAHWFSAAASILLYMAEQ